MIRPGRMLEMSPGENHARRFRPASIILASVLVGIALLPVVVLISCAGSSGGVTSFPQAAPPPPRPEWRGDRWQVRVALAEKIFGGKEYDIEVRGAFEIHDATTNTVLVRGARLTHSPVQALSNGVVLAIPQADGSSKVMHLDKIKVVPLRNGTLYVSGRPYRGKLEILYKPGGRMTLVNLVDLEDYVAGVVPSEMFHYWPREALRAQAVVARTYALAVVVENDKMPGKRPEFDFAADFRYAQEYKGMMEERPAPSEAVRATEGEVLHYNGEVFRTYFSSTCGGHTEAPGQVWKDYATIPPLAGGECEYCKRSKWYTWEDAIPLGDIEKALDAARQGVGHITDVQFADTNGDGHMDRVTVTGTQRSVKFLGNDFRLMMIDAKREKLINSTLLSLNFEATREGDSLVLKGHGFGHGVGLCQWGAKGMADALFNYKKILDYYYPGSTLVKIY